MAARKIAVFGGGCFWCTEAVFSAGGSAAYGGKIFKGIISVTPGYAGGSSTHSADAQGGEQSRTARLEQAPTYEQVSAGRTGYAEVVRIEYDPERIAYRDLLTVFFGTHDPTTLNRQGADIGPQYRSVVFYGDEEQKKEAEEFIEELNASSPEGQPIVTAIEPLADFYEAEEYHKNYYAKNLGNPYCEVVINPKLKKAQEKFAELLNSNG